MARYTTLFSAVAEPKLRDTLAQTLVSCDLNLVYEAADYLMAKEKPGQVSMTQLATVEVLINPPRTGENQSQVNLVVKNEELPLSRNNHCQQVFNLVNQAITASV